MKNKAFERVSPSKAGTSQSGRVVRQCSPRIYSGLPDGEAGVSPASRCGTYGSANRKRFAFQKSLFKIAPSNLYEGENIVADRKLISTLNRPPATLLIEKKVEKKINKHLKTLRAIFLPAGTIYFNGECSLREVSRICCALKKKSVKTLFAMGGGKLIDTSKLVAEKLNLKLITIPTSAATCAAFTSIAPTYKNNGEKFKTFELKKPPDCCLIDYGILMNQPKRLIISGIADAAAKYFETRAYLESNPEVLKIPSVASAYQLSCEIHKNIKEHSQDAIDHLENGKRIRLRASFLKIIYTNIILAGLVGGIGGKKCRSLAAHSLYNGLTYIPQLRKSLHGEKVGWGILVQLTLEKKFNELEALARFFSKIGAPVSLRQLGLKTLNFKRIKKALDMALAPGENIRLLSKNIDAKKLWEAVEFVENHREEQ